MSEFELVVVFALGAPNNPDEDNVDDEVSGLGAPKSPPPKRDGFVAGVFVPKPLILEKLGDGVLGMSPPLLSEAFLLLGTTEYCSAVKFSSCFILMLSGST